MKRVYLSTISLLMILAIGFSGCMKEQDWKGSSDVDLPIPSITSISATSFSVGDIIELEGDFKDLSTVTIGGCFATISSISDDYTLLSVEVTETCSTGYLILENLFKQTYKYPSFITIIGGAVGPVIPGDVVIMDFSEGTFFPTWTASQWVEAKDFDEVGYDLNDEELELPNGYEHSYAMNDKDLFPPSEAAGQGGNIPYGNITSNNGGAGFDLSAFTDPYVSILINTGVEDIAYMSLVLDDQIIDLSSSQCDGGMMANGETKSYMKTDGKWLWYSFSLSKITGDKLPEKLSSAGLFIRNSWDYGADIYPGFQLNIIQMVVTEGALPKKIVLYDFEDQEPQTTDVVTGWASDVMTSSGRNLGELESIPSGDYYYSMQAYHDDGSFNYKFALKNDNDGAGFDLSDMLNPYITFAVNTGERSGFIDFVFYQAASGNKEAEPWADPAANNSAVELYPEALAQDGVQGFYFDTKGEWEWRTYDLRKLLNGVESWGLQGGLYPNFEEIFDYILIWPRDGWNNDLAAPRYEMNLDYVIITDGLPTALPALN